MPLRSEPPLYVYELVQSIVYSSIAYGFTILMYSSILCMKVHLSLASYTVKNTIVRSSPSILVRWGAIESRLSLARGIHVRILIICIPAREVHPYACVY